MEAPGGQQDHRNLKDCTICCSISFFSLLYWSLRALQANSSQHEEQLVSPGVPNKALQHLTTPQFELWCSDVCSEW